MSKALLQFASDFSNAAASFYLMELPDELLKQVEADHTVKFEFKGRDEEEAVLVTDSRTYAVRRGETSNSQLLFSCSSQEMLSHCSENESDQDIASRNIEVMFHTGHVFELMPAKPRLKALPELLSRCPYEGSDSKGDNMGNEIDLSLRPTLDELESILQASRSEIVEELNRLGALKMDGRYCQLSLRYESNLMTDILSSAVLNSWSLDLLTLPLLQSEKDLRDYPTEVLCTFLSKYSRKSDASFTEAISSDALMAGGTVALDTHKIVLTRADELLAALPPNQRLSQDEFITAWQTMAPPGVPVRLEYLRGRAVVEQRGAARVVKRFAVDGLSPDPKARFRQLFQQSPTWSREDLLAYIGDLVGPGQSGDQLLLKHTRVTRTGTPGKDEVRTYSARV